MDRGDLRICSAHKLSIRARTQYGFAICFVSPEMYDAEGLLFNNRFVPAFYHFIDAVPYKILSKQIYIHSLQVISTYSRCAFMEIYLQSRPCASYACTLSYTSHLPSVYGVVMFTRDKIMLIFIKSRVNAQKQKESAILCKRSVDLICIYCSNRVITTIFYKSMTTRPGCKPVDFVGSATRALVQLHYKLYNRAP